MDLFNRRFARLCTALSQTLARAVDTHAAPEPPGRDAWIDGASSEDELWSGVKSPQWAIHLAHHVGLPPRVMMDAGTEQLSRSLEGYIEGMPTVLDYGTIEPQARQLDTYFDWAEQPLEDLTDGRERYEAAAIEQLERLRAQADSGPEVSPYRDSARWPNELAPRLHRLVATSHWFAAARHASESPPRRPAMRDDLGVALAHAFASRPRSHDVSLQELVGALRASSGA